MSSQPKTATKTEAKTDACASQPETATKTGDCASQPKAAKTETKTDGAASQPKAAKAETKTDGAVSRAAKALKRLGVQLQEDVELIKESPPKMNRTQDLSRL